jgi:hypothetical protein
VLLLYLRKKLTYLFLQIFLFTCYLSSLYNPNTDRIGNISSIIAWSFVAGETCPQSCSLATVVVLCGLFTQLLFGSGSTCHNIILQFMHRPFKPSLLFRFSDNTCVCTSLFVFIFLRVLHVMPTLLTSLILISLIIFREN